jgi:hypothetical protein
VGCIVYAVLSKAEKGDLAELGFIYEVKQRRLGVILLPYGNTHPYDVAVDIGSKILKIQIKSAHVKTIRKTNGRGYYVVSCGHHGGENRNKQPYSVGDFDILAATVIPLHTWYIIPADEAILRTTINLYPSECTKANGGLWEKYRDRWDLLS